jgi:diguanylate cyclase (GGDEF)-like protein/PAS domain S-box-containing protein
MLPIDAFDSDRVVPGRTAHVRRSRLKAARRPVDAPGMDDGAQTTRGQLRRRVLDPSVFALVIVIPVFWGARGLGLIADQPMWLLVALLVATWLVSSVATVVFPDGCTGWRLWVRISLLLGGTTAVMYAIGWGPTLAIGLLFGAVDCIRLCGLRSVVPTIVLSALCLGVGELAIALDLVPSLVAQPLVHGLAFLATLGVAMTIVLFARATREKEQAQDDLRQSELRFRALVQHASDIILVIAADGELRYASPAFSTVLGYSVEATVGTSSLAFADPDDADVLRSAFRRDNTTAHRAEVRMRHQDGSWLWFEVTVTNLFDDPSVGGWVANLRDVTERRKADAALQQAQAAFQHAFEDAPNGMALVGLDGRIVRANRAIAELFMRTPEDAVGLAVRDLTHPDDRESSAAHLRRLAAGEIDQYRMEKRYLRPDGRIVWAELSVSLVRDADGDPAYAIGQLQDITERRALGDRLAHEAAHDVMTGLPNRARFMERLELALEGCRDGDGGIAVMFVDLDQFKIINDGLGHAAGDQVLATVADRLRQVLRSSDVVARFGGDEFTVLLEDLEDENEAVRVADRILARLQERLEIDGHRVVAHACIGIALSKPTHARPEDVVRDADRALQKAKALGKPGFQVFDSAMDGRAMSLAQLEAALRHALDREEFRTHYQPIVSVKGGKVAGFEVLLWRRSPNGPNREPGRGGVQ